MEAEAVERLRLEGAVRYYGGHKHPDCEGTDPETCRCGYSDLLEKLRNLRENEDADRGGRNAGPMD